MTLTHPPTLSPPRPAHLTGWGTLKFLFFPCRAELPSLRQIFVELLPSCAPSASQEHKIPAEVLPWQPLSHLWEGKRERRAARKQRTISLSVSKCSGAFHCVPKQAGRAGKLGCARGCCYRAAVPGSQTIFVLN